MLLSAMNSNFSYQIYQKKHESNIWNASGITKMVHFIKSISILKHKFKLVLMGCERDNSAKLNIWRFQFLATKKICKCEISLTKGTDLSKRRR